MKPQHVTVLISIVLFVFATGASCQRRESAVQRGTREQVLHRGAGTEPSTLDPQRNYGHPENMIIRELFDSLVVSDSRGNEVKPNGAERWEVSSDGLTYTFHLRPNARWSNGDPVTAEDYRASFLRLIEPALGATLAYLADVIVGAEDYRRGQTKDAATVGITTEGPHVLRLRLREPSASLLNHLEHYPFVAVHRPSIEANGGWLNPMSPWTRPGKMVSNGAFTLREWKPGNVLVLERNPHHWNAAQVKLREIRNYPFESIDSEERAFRARQLHMTYGLPPARFSSYRTAQSPALRVAPSLGFHCILLNTRKPPLDDVRVRRALALALDRRNIAEKVLGMGETPAFSLGQPNMGGYRPTRQLEENPAEARRLLTEAGFPGGTGFPRLSYLLNTSERNRDVAEAIQQMWKRELGIDIVLENQEWRVYLDRRRLGDFEIARAAWTPFTSECSEYFDLLRTGRINNYTGWSNPAFDDLLKRAHATMDRDARHALYQVLDGIVIEEMPLIPFAYFSVARLVDPVVQGWQHSIRDALRLSTLWLSPGDAP